MILNKKNFIKSINTNFVFENKPFIAVAVSGGPDSMCLIHLLNEWNKNVNGKLIALIIDHNLRKDSLAEAKLVKTYLDDFGINSKILSTKKNRVVKRNMNEARVNRYHLLTNFCIQNNILYLFVAHHADDNLETFLYRKISGSDFEGLFSIKFVSLINKINVIRPLINFKKKQILNYNLKNKIPFVNDPSNLNIDYTRPMIRKFILNSNSKLLNQIEKDFLKIKNNYNPYKNMISEILIYNIIKIKRNFVEINIHKFLKLDFLLCQKIIRIIYYFFYKKNNVIRTNKIEILMKLIDQNNFQIFNLRGMLIKKVNNSVIFCKISN